MSDFHKDLVGADIHIPFPYGAEAWIDSRAYATLVLADTAAFVAGKVLLVTQNYTLLANTVLTATCRVLPGGGFTKASTFTLTINGPFEAPTVQIFTGFATGDVTFGPGTIKEALAEWWGAKADGSTASATAIQCAIDSVPYGVVRLSSGIYMIGTTLTITNRIALVGSGFGAATGSGQLYGTMLKKSADVLGILVKSGANLSVLKDFTLYANLVGDTTDGIQIGEADHTNGAGGGLLENIDVEGMGGVGINVFNGNVGRMVGIHASANGSHGVMLHNRQLSVANVNAWTLLDIHTFSNGGDGLHIGTSPSNNVFGFTSEGNTGWGLYVDYPKNRIVGHIDVSNVAGDVYTGSNAYSCIFMISSVGHRFTELNSLNFWLSLDDLGLFPNIKYDGTFLSKADIQILNGFNLKGYSGFGSGLTFNLDAATGDITTPGNVTAASFIVSGGSEPYIAASDFALISGWGLGASLNITASYYHKQAFIVVVTPGTGPSVRPILQFTPPALYSSSGEVVPMIVVYQNSNGATSVAYAYPGGGGVWNIVYTGTPLVGDNLTFVCHFTV